MASFTGCWLSAGPRSSRRQPGPLHLIPKPAGERISANVPAHTSAGLMFVYVPWCKQVRRRQWGGCTPRQDQSSIASWGCSWGRSCNDLPVPSPVFHFSLSRPEGDWLFSGYKAQLQNSVQLLLKGPTPTPSCWMVEIQMWILVTAPSPLPGSSSQVSGLGKHDLLWAIYP